MEAARAGRLPAVRFDVQLGPDQQPHMLGEALGQPHAVALRQHREQPRDALVRAQFANEGLDHIGHQRIGQRRPRGEQRLGTVPVQRLCARLEFLRFRRPGGKRLRRRPPALALSLARLHLVHRLVGATQQLLAIGRHMIREKRDAEAGGQLEHGPFDPRGLAQRQPQAIEQRFDLGGIAQAFADDHELVAAQPGDIVVRSQRTAQPARHLHQHQIAGGVAEAVVDRLEVVQVEHARGDQPPAALGALQGGFQMDVQRAAIRQSGQRVMHGQVGLPLLLLQLHATAFVLAQRKAGHFGQFVEHAAHLVVERILFHRDQGEHAKRPGRLAGHRVGQDDRPASAGTHAGKHTLPPDRRHVVALGRTNADLRLALAQREDRQRHAAAVERRGRGQLGKLLGDRTDQGHATQRPVVAIHRVHVHRRRTGDLHQRLGQGAIHRARIRLFEQRALDRALGIAIAADSTLPPGRGLVVPEPRQLAGQPRQPGGDVFEPRLRRIAGAGGQHQVSAIARGHAHRNAGQQAGVPRRRRIACGRRCCGVAHDARLPGRGRRANRVVRCDAHGIGAGQEALHAIRRRSGGGQHVDALGARRTPADPGQRQSQRGGEARHHLGQREAALLALRGAQSNEGFGQALVETRPQFTQCERVVGRVPTRTRTLRCPFALFHLDRPVSRQHAPARRRRPTARLLRGAALRAPPSSSFGAPLANRPASRHLTLAPVARARCVECAAPHAHSPPDAAGHPVKAIHVRIRAGAKRRTARRWLFPAPRPRKIGGAIVLLSRTQCGRFCQFPAPDTRIKVCATAHSGRTP